MPHSSQRQYVCVGIELDRIGLTKFNHFSIDLGESMGNQRRGEEFDVENNGWWNQQTMSSEDEVEVYLEDYGVMYVE